jgi:hypothetical protein
MIADASRLFAAWSGTELSWSLSTHRVASRAGFEKFEDVQDAVRVVSLDEIQKPRTGRSTSRVTCCRRLQVPTFHRLPEAIAAFKDGAQALPRSRRSTCAKVMHRGRLAVNERAHDNKASRNSNRISGAALCRHPARPRRCRRLQAVRQSWGASADLLQATAVRDCVFSGTRTIASQQLISPKSKEVTYHPTGTRKLPLGRRRPVARPDTRRRRTRNIKRSVRHPRGRALEGRARLPRRTSARSCRGRFAPSRQPTRPARRHLRRRPVDQQVSACPTSRSRISFEHFSTQTRSRWRTSPRMSSATPTNS